MELWQQITCVLGVIGIIGGFLYWHFSSIHALKDRLVDLEKKCESHATKDALKSLELQMKDLETKDALQQQTLDQLNALYPTLVEAMKIIKEKRRS